MVAQETPVSSSPQLGRAVLRKTIPCALSCLVIESRPLVMGVLNVTPDSFSDGGSFFDPEDAFRRALQMVSEGADLIDIGGESTRPGASPVPAAEELRRVIPVIRRLAKTVSLPLAVDTSKAEVAAEALEAGASIVNDVTALQADPKMAPVIARSKAAIILMHMAGTPRTMQLNPCYQDVVREVGDFLRRAAAQAEKAGIERPRILIDPGLGFGKTVAHNLELMRSLASFESLGFPIVIGPSRKSFIGKVLGADVHERLAGTLACVAQAERCGAAIVRVHDVKPAVELLRTLQAIEHGRPADGEKAG